MHIVRNSLANSRTSYGSDHLAVVSLDEARRAERLIGLCPLSEPTPLRALPALATRLGLARVLVKDETARLGLSSFKALGGAYAVMLRSPRGPSRGGLTAARAALPTFATATDGNHGISVAAGAWLSGSRCVCFLPGHVEQAYEDVMRLLGADVVRVRGTYDVAVARAAEVAASEGWTIVSDTTQEPFDPVTRDVLAGYGVMVNECARQLEECRSLRGPNAVTHVFVQGGVGGLAAALAGGLWQRLGAQRPHFVIVEPRAADCLFQTAAHGELRSASGDLVTRMSMLSCGRPSRMAWTILRDAADHFVTIDDADADLGVEAFQLEQTRLPRVTTPSGACGIAGLIAAASDADVRAQLRLTDRSVVLTVCTESRPDEAAVRSLMSGMRQVV